jgi:hypothetical protein
VRWRRTRWLRPQQHGFVLQDLAVHAQDGGQRWCEKTPFLCHFCTNVIILPRQAREKHREISKGEAFCAGIYVMGRQPGSRMYHNFISEQGEPPAAAADIQFRIRRRKSKRYFGWL